MSLVSRLRRRPEGSPAAHDRQLARASLRPRSNVVPDTLTGTLETLPAVESPELGNSRDLLVHLPPGYAESDRRYPVLYMHDGQNLFDAATAYAGVEWAADEAAEALSRRGLQSILVALPNNPERMLEYGPFPSRENGHRPKGDAYADFLAQIVKPLVDARYRTMPDAAQTGVLGASMGGLISLYTALRHPGAFGFAGAMSPSLWFAGRSIFRWVEAHPNPALRVYLDIGSAEGPGTRTGPGGFVRDTTRMAELLALQGNSVHLVVERDGVHSESAWRRRFPGALEWFLAEAARC